ncbi:ESX secretion-associated protein EspG [Prauserella cavernicola]|uniref:ESX secretion-associated protein EspG n=1 Tax=Prauserella cavernicola TaxID=2800127 RepID=A0A934V4S8_9PSEU|nr:ESX secretion-associated protein EspG [Prauserella cavernicola]MBK1785727.1 ESX secretion-associated protein EspG [Prauserella cavernicola]
MRPNRVELPLDVLGGLVDRERLGTLHVVLQPEPRWVPDHEQDALEAALTRSLTEAGLVDRRGRVEVELLDWLPLLTTASLEYYGWISHADTTWGVLAAARGVQGVLAVRGGDWVTLTPVGRNELADAFVEQLPELVPGGGTQWSVRVIDLEEAGRSGHGRGLPADVAEIVKVVQRPVSGGGELYVAERDELGRYDRLEAPLHYVDTDWGRYLNYTSGSGDETEIHIAPGSPSAISATLEKLRTTLAG